MLGTASLSIAATAAADLALSLRRHPSTPVAPEGFPRTAAAHPYMLEHEWVHDARWASPPADLAAFGVLAERLYAQCERAARTALMDDARLDAFGFGAEREVMRRSLARGERPLVARLDFALVPAPGREHHYALRLLEINGDTASNLVEGALLQAEWGAATGRRTAGDGMEAALAEALRALPGPLCVLHHPGDLYICATARYLASLVPGAGRVEYPRVPDDDAGAVYKVFRWGRLWAGRFPEVAAWAARREAGIWEPAWAVLLQHKGLLADLWAAHPDEPAILPATLDGAHALPDGGAGGWAHKSFHGVSGFEVVVAAPGEDVAPLAHAGVWQTRVAPVCVDGVYPVLCAVLVGGRYAGAVMREDDTPISTDDIVCPIEVIA